MSDVAGFDPHARPIADEDERFQELFAEFGLAMMLAQAVERSVVTLLAAAAVRDGVSVSGQQLHTFLDTRNRQTLGRLIGELTETVKLSGETEQFLRIALPARNWLTHHFFRQYGPSGFEPVAAHEATTLIRHTRAMFEATMDELHREESRVLAEAGIQRDVAQARAEAAMAEARVEDTS